MYIYQSQWHRKQLENRRKDRNRLIAIVVILILVAVIQAW